MTALSRQQFRIVEAKLHACFSQPNFPLNVSRPSGPCDLEQMIWRKVSLCVYQRFQNTSGQAPFSVWFGQPRQTVEDACEKIPLGKSMFLQWRERIVLAAALYASQLGVFQPLSPIVSNPSCPHKNLPLKGD